MLTLSLASERAAQASMLRSIHAVFSWTSDHLEGVEPAHEAPVLVGALPTT